MNKGTSHTAPDATGKATGLKAKAEAAKAKAKEAANQPTVKSAEKDGKMLAKGRALRK